jgi:ATP-dependent DNA helicase RecG
MKHPEHESVTLEFKSRMPKNDQIIKTIIGFCNQHGGKLVLGVDDDRTIIGLNEEQVLEAMEYLERSVYIASSPPILPKVISQRIGDKMLLVIEVSEGMNKPYYRHAVGLDKGTYIRVGKNTIRASSDTIEELTWQSRGLSYENLAVYQADEKTLDHVKIQTFLADRRQQSKANVTRDVMLSYKLITEEHAKIYASVAGILLFGKQVQHYFSEAMIICSHFKGTQGREAIAALDCNGTLFEQLEQAYHFIISRLTHTFSIKGIKREEQLEIPQIAIREILLNAIIHRNYHLRAPIKIAIYDDRLEIFSPGNFPTPLPNLHLGLTDARNMTICRIFREANLIEKLGSGFITVFENYRERGLPDPIIHDGDGFVKCILPRNNYKTFENSTLHEQILDLFDVATEISVSDVMKAYNLPRSSTSRKLAEMVEKGALKTTGAGKGTKYTK